MRRNKSEERRDRDKQDIQFRTYNVTFRRVRPTIVALEKQ